ncbi:MAG TPA: ATP-binding protein [Mycobacteriales bacterium]
MSAVASRAGRPGIARAAGAARARAREPIVRLVVGVCLLGGALALAVTLGFADRGSVLHGVRIPGPWLLAGLILLTFLAEVTVVRLRHGDTVEALSLYEAALIIDVLLLPPAHALLAAVLGLVVALVVLRRPLVKVLFNLGNFAAAVCALITVVHTVGGTPGTLSARALAAVLLGTAAFTAVNLCCMAVLLGTVNGVSPWTIIRSEARLSAYMGIGTLATGLTTAEIGLHAPMLLPFMAMPALAMRYAYRAAAQEAEERTRSAVLLRLSHALAERDDVVGSFLLLAREAFDADLAVVVLDRADVALSVDGDAPADVHAGEIPDCLAGLRDLDRPTLLAEGLPGDLRQMLVVPLESGGGRFGVAALASRSRHARLSTRDLIVLGPLGNALAAALARAEHLDRLVEETSKLQAIVEQSTEGILMVDGDGVVQTWSRALADLTGIAGTEVGGRTIAELLQVPDVEERDLLLPVTADHPTAVVELTIRRPDGEPRRLRLAHSAVFADGDLVRDVVVVGDLTREHRAERLKSDFIATVSHELRTPLTPIVGYVDLLRTRGERMTPQKRRDVLDLVADRAAHMSRLVEDLLLASRVEGPEGDMTLNVNPGVHDLTAIVRQVVDDLDSPRLVPELPAGPALVRCDDGRALQVVANLVGNALKYSQEEAQVHVALRLDGDHARVEVADHGRGIPADQLTKVFEKFHRVEDPMTMSTSGTGLGLFIARRLARAMGGDIGVTSTLNVGSVFTFVLRRAEEPGAGPATTAEPNGARTAKDRSVSDDGEADPALHQAHAVR